ncbi:hypothetical protein [Gordonia humi]|uniref:Uncharacterized protein n=1 Tax=Gordonia humi TaxID=686429 RepID=A0A840FFC7_9ACTN|nr:hypothetical protein [Gordonia humi]MBB4138147.1 hypothetical protein [Gordonia humi]
MSIDDIDVDQMRADVFRPSRFCWDSLDRVAAARLWDELVRWVDWLRYRYEIIEKIPPCWYRHPRLVEELTALMTAHRAAYTQIHAEGKTGRPYWPDMASWHTQYLRPFLAIVRDFGIASCDINQCRKLDAPPYRGLPPELGDWIDTDLAQRREPAPAAPGPVEEPSIAPGQMNELMIAGKARPARVDEGEPR